MFLCFPDGHDMHYCPATAFEIIRNQRAMAAPPDRFGAHVRSLLFVSQRLQLFDRFFEIIRLHEIRVSSECIIAPHCVFGIWNCFSSSAQFW